MESCKPLPTPFPAKSDVVLDELLKPIENPDPVLNKQFQELIGQLLYCQQQTVPEISWCVSILARFTTKAGAPHMALAKKVLRYLQGRKRIPLRWCARSCQQPHLPGHIYGYADLPLALLGAPVDIGALVKTWVTVTVSWQGQDRDIKQNSKELHTRTCFRRKIWH